MDFPFLLFTLTVFLCHPSYVCSVLVSNQPNLSWFHQTLEIWHIKGLSVDFKECKQVFLKVMQKEG